MTTARVGAQQGYDRFVVQFSGAMPRFDVRLQGSPTFTADGGTVTLQGSAGLVVTLYGASGGGAYSGPTDMQPGFIVIREARLLTDANGLVVWGIGLGELSCFHAWTLSGPTRLVVDIAD